MTMNLILWLSILWVPVLLYVTMANEAKPKKNIAVGVTFPQQAWADVQLNALLARYKKELQCITAGLLVSGLFCMFFVRKMGPALTVYMIWIDLAVVLPYLPYVKCNKALKALKQERGWRPAAARSVTVDLAALPEPHWLPVWSFAPAFLMALAPVLWYPQGWFVCATNGACVLLFWVCYRYAYRNKAEMVDENTQLTLALTRVRRYHWGRMWLVGAYSMALLSFAVLFIQRGSLLFAVSCVLLCIIMSGAFLSIELRVRKVQEKLTAQSGQSWYVDEDDRWIGGIFYYNPDDSRFMVNSRIGLNTTMNMAKKSAQIFTGFMVALLLALPLVGVWIGDLGTKEITLSVTQDTLTCVCGGTEYTIPLEEIETITLREELPENLVRSWGTGLETYLEGNFTAGEGIGMVKLCLDPTNPPYLYLDTVHGNYLLASRDAQVTRLVYQQILGVR